MNKEYFFISKPRCASTHIFEGLTNWNDKKHGGKPHYHLTSQQMEQVFKQKYKQSFSFSVVRHPYDLVLSWYNEHRKDRYDRRTRSFYNMELHQWIKQGCQTHWNHLNFNPLHQYKWVYDNNNISNVSYIIKLENYNENIEHVYNKIHKYLPKDVTLESIKQTRKNETKTDIQLTVEQKNNIYNLFKKDFELFGYVK
jgi:hypothetical protein